MFTGSKHVVYSYIELISNDHESKIPKIHIYCDYTICYDWRLMVIMLAITCTCLHIYCSLS